MKQSHYHLQEYLSFSSISVNASVTKGKIKMPSAKKTSNLEVGLAKGKKKEK